MPAGDPDLPGDLLDRRVEHPALVEQPSRRGDQLAFTVADTGHAVHCTRRFGRLRTVG